MYAKRNIQLIQQHSQRVCQKKKNPSISASLCGTGYSQLYGWLDRLEQSKVDAAFQRLHPAQGKGLSTGCRGEIMDGLPV
jgi:hypothetical protein